MSDTLSSLIAFVGFLIVFSMMVQAMQEGFKNVLKLKSGTWERFFHSIYEKEFFFEKTQDTKLKSILERINTVDSVGDFNERLKRLRTIVADTDQALKKLKELLLIIIKPDPAASATPNFEEIKQTLDEITGLKLDSLLKIYDKYSTDGKIKVFYEELRAFGNKLNLPADSTLSNISEDCNKIYGLIIINEKKIGEYKLQIESKIDSWLSQINEEYRRNMLKWTVIIGTSFVLLFNADSFSIYRYLSHDSKLRDAIIKNVTESTAKIQHTNPEILNTIDTKLKSDKLEEAKKYIIDFSKILQEDYAAYGAKDQADDITKMIAAIEKDPIAPETDKEKAKAFLEDKANKLTLMYVGMQKISIDYQIGSLSSLDLPLGWSADWKELVKSYKKITCATACSFCALLLKKLGGLLMTSFLITFGAPFWNDILSTLVGIKNMSLKKGLAEPNVN